MTTALLRSRMRRLAVDEEAVEGGELNLVPFLDMVTNIILFLFVTLSFSAALAAVPVRAPIHDDNGGGVVGPQEPLGLTFHISDGGFTVAGTGGVLHQAGTPGRIPTLPKVAGELDYAGLTRLAGEIKRAHPGESAIHITADDRIPYEQVIGAIDAVRGTPAAPLFTVPQLAKIGDQFER